MSKLFTTLTLAWPEFPITSALTRHFVPEPGAFLLLWLGVMRLGLVGRGRSKR